MSQHPRLFSHELARLAVPPPGADVGVSPVQCDEQVGLARPDRARDVGPAGSGRSRGVGVIEARQVLAPILDAVDQFELFLGVDGVGRPGRLGGVASTVDRLDAGPVGPVVAAQEATHLLRRALASVVDDGVVDSPGEFEHTRRWDRTLIMVQER